MILQTGNRTDIPAFYSEWFTNRLKEGFVLVRNPFNPTAVTRYRLDPSVVDLMVFCTKNPAPLLDSMEYLRPFRQYWFVTITPYGKDIEPNVPDKEEVMDSFIRLAGIVGPEHTCWRYDPIFLDETRTEEYHLERFSSMCGRLSGHTRTVVISFIDLYEKVKRNFPEVRTVPFEIQLHLTEKMVQIAQAHRMVLKPCGEDPRLARVGADCSGCMTQKVFEEAIGENLILPPNPKNRAECACYITADIGAYNTCGHFCRYCYANTDRKAVQLAMKLHGPQSPMLIGHPGPDDIIRDAKQVSWIDPQLRMTFT